MRSLFVQVMGCGKLVDGRAGLANFTPSVTLLLEAMKANQLLSRG